MSVNTRNAFSLIVAFATLMLFSSSYASNTEPRNFVLSVSANDGKRLSDAQLQAAKDGSVELPEYKTGVALQEEFRATDIWFLSVHAPDQQAVDAYLAAIEIDAISIYESLFVNSPEVGGGPKAGKTPKDGHNVYMIQRQIPGIGLAPLDRKVAVSKGSQKIIDSLDGKVEWDHSFLTSEGTFCVYRAGDPAMIKEHARIAGIPADPITEVEHLVRNLSF